MGLTLTIENETSLPDGGPLSVSVTGKRGLDIGRDQHLDWTLPDPTRYISGKHCEIRYRDGGYWLYDVSSNGTFLNGSDGRIKAPHRLRSGDRLTIGQYIVAVALDGEEAANQRAAAPVAQHTSYQELWKSADDAAPPVDRNLLRPPAEHQPLRPDFLHWAVDVPDTYNDPVQASQPSPRDTRPPADDVWSQGAQRAAPAPEPTPAMPAPRRPVWVSGEPGGPWSAPPPTASAAADSSAMDYPAPPRPAPGRAPPPPTAPPPAPADPALAGDFIRQVAQGANIPEQFIARDSGQLAHELGELIRLVAENMKQLLNARLQAKRLARMSSQTTIEALNNNPMKFAPTTDEALRIMFGPPSASYLDARRSFEEGFRDIKEHQIRTYSAMQQALAMLIEDLDPQAIDRATDAGGRLGGVLGSRKAQLWDSYVARWQAKTRGQEGGLVDVFMQYFAECYERGETRRR